jgi:hypothetical protein
MNCYYCELIFHSKNKLKGEILKTYYIAIFISFFATNIFSQPLSGSYTIGGSSPDFATLQEAADTLEVNGVSGPVFFNIRPGIYMENGGNNTVLILNGIVTGLSESNRVTFQPDAAAGGNVGNTILQMNITNTSTADPQLVLINLDFISFKNITFQESDASLNTGNCNLVQLQRNSLTGTLTVDGIVFEGCRFIGTDPSAGTETGIEFGQGVSNITFQGNTFLRLLRGISGVAGTSFSTGNMIIEDNQFLEGWRSSSGSGNPLGSAMEIFSENLIIRKNIIDFNGSFNSGYRGITILVMASSETIIVEQNSIKGAVSASIVVQGQSGNPDSLIIANNMINAVAFPVWANEAAIGISISQNPGIAHIIFNTVVLSGGGLIGLFVDAANSTVLNNIIITNPNSGFNVCYQQGTSTNFQSDYNVLFTTNNPQILVVCPLGIFYDLPSYQVATGLDTNSISKDIDFVDSTNLHISDCQAQDPDLKGIPVAGITVDIDEEIRSTTAPMIGADENSFTGFQMFSDPFRAALPGTAFAIAADNFDNILYDGIVVPDYDNRQVLLYHNLPPRSFELSSTLSTSFKPVVVKFYDLDEDNHLDLIVGGDTSAVAVFWGDGAGGFSAPVTVGTYGRVRSLEPGPTLTGDIKRTIVITQDNGFASTESTMGYLMHLGSRNLCHDVQWFQTSVSPPIFSFPDTVNAVMTDFVFGEFSGDGGFPEIAAVTSSPLPHPLILVSDIEFPGFPGNCTGFIPLGTITEHQLGGVGSTAGQSNIVMGDFDGDTDLDLITLETFSSVKFIRNQGNLNLTSESISVSGAMGLASMDYENDGDLDFITVNDQLQTNGITVFLNDGLGNFTARENCFFKFATGLPRSVVASDFDQDGKTDIALVSSVAAGVDSLFVLYNLGGGTVGIQEEETENIATSFSLAQNFPNPFNPTTTIQYSLPQAGNINLKIYNLLGEEVKTLADEYKEAGKHSVQFNANNLASGIYFYRIQAGSFVETKKMTLIK